MPKAASLCVVAAQSNRTRSSPSRGSRTRASRRALPHNCHVQSQPSRTRKGNALVVIGVRLGQHGGDNYLRLRLLALLAPAAERAAGCVLPAYNLMTSSSFAPSPPKNTRKRRTARSNAIRLMGFEFSQVSSTAQKQLGRRIGKQIYSRDGRRPFRGAVPSSGPRGSCQSCGASLPLPAENPSPRKCAGQS